MIREIIGILGLLLVALGTGMIYRPAGVIALGLELVIFALFAFGIGKKTGN